MVRVLVVLAVLAGCRPPTPYARSIRDVVVSGAEGPHAAPVELRAAPHELGQTATYLRRVRGVVGYERLSFATVDACGAWYQLEIVEPSMRSRWTFCVRATVKSHAAVQRDLASDDALDALQVVIAEPHGEERAVWSFRDGRNPDKRAAFGWLLARVHRHTWVDRYDLPREDVVVPAGTFSSAVRTAAATGTYAWHPGAPFDGLVRWTSADGRDEIALRDHRRGREWSIAVQMARPPPRQSQSSFPALVQFGGGMGWELDATDTRSSLGLNLQFAIGYRGATLQPMLRSRWSTSDRGTTFASTLNLRWTPQRWIRHPDSPGPYVRVGLGLGTDQLTDESLGALAVDAAVGFLTGDQRRDTMIGVELTEQLLVLGERDVVNQLLLTCFYEFNVW